VSFLVSKRIYIFLSAIGIYKPQDIRPILAAYQGKDIPLEYAKKEAEAKALHVEKWSKDRPQGLASTSFSSMLGLSPVRLHSSLLSFTL
jgi:import inner membrane translocase subunit TIM50